MILLSSENQVSSKSLCNAKATTTRKKRQEAQVSKFKIQSKPAWPCQRLRGRCSCRRQERRNGRLHGGWACKQDNLVQALTDLSNFQQRRRHSVEAVVQPCALPVSRKLLVNACIWRHCLHSTCCKLLKAKGEGRRKGEETEQKRSRRGGRKGEEREKKGSRRGRRERKGKEGKKKGSKRKEKQTRMKMLTNVLNVDGCVLRDLALGFLMTATTYSVFSSTQTKSTSEARWCL